MAVPKRKKAKKKLLKPTPLRVDKANRVRFPPTRLTKSRFYVETHERLEYEEARVQRSPYRAHRKFLIKARTMWTSARYRLPSMFKLSKKNRNKFWEKKHDQVVHKRREVMLEKKLRQALYSRSQKWRALAIVNWHRHLVNYRRQVKEKPQSPNNRVRGSSGINTEHTPPLLSEILAVQKKKIYKKKIYPRTTACNLHATRADPTEKQKFVQSKAVRSLGNCFISNHEDQFVNENNIFFFKKNKLKFYDWRWYS